MTSTETTHALYRFFDQTGALLYVGITNNPGRRWSQHQGDKPWWHDVARIEMEPHPDRPTVLAAERAAIAAERPRYNVVHAGSAAEPVAATTASNTEWPVAVDDCVALGCGGGVERSCPVGLVTAVGPWGVTLDLMSFWDGTFGHETVTLPWPRIEEIRHARRKPREDWNMLEHLAGTDTVFDTVPLGDFQTLWIHGRDRMREQRMERARNA